MGLTWILVGLPRKFFITMGPGRSLTLLTPETPTRTCTYRNGSRGLLRLHVGPNSSYLTVSVFGSNRRQSPSFTSYRQFWQSGPLLRTRVRNDSQTIQWICKNQRGPTGSGRHFPLGEVIHSTSEPEVVNTTSCLFKGKQTTVGSTDNVYRYSVLRRYVYEPNTGTVSQVTPSPS